MATPAPKRRKLDSVAAANKTLLRPFRSPLKRASVDLSYETPTQQHDVSKRDAQQSENISRSESMPPIRSKAPTAPANPSNSSVVHSSESAIDHDRIALQPRREATANALKPHRPSGKIAQEVQDSNRDLAAKIRTYRDDIDLLEQAARITQKQDDDLSKLITKWRDVSRAAAEELFGGVKDKVNRMGGVQAWRDKETERRRWRQDMAEEVTAPESDDDDDDDDEEGEDPEVRERRKEMKANLKQERKDRAEALLEHSEYDQRVDERAVSSNAENSPKNDDAFTMDMMLHTLNVDLDVIGYSLESQRWID